jgi:hypothetical protein
MAQTISQIAQIEFDAQIKAAYQSTSRLTPHVRVRTGVIGATASFRRAGRGVATSRIPQSDVVPMNIQYGSATATLTDWNAAEWSDQLDQALTNIDERSIIVQNVAGAIGRRKDQMIIDALDAAYGSPVIPLNASGLTDAKMRRAMAIFDSRAVPLEDRKMIISARGKEDLIGEQRFTSRDFVTQTVIETGRLPPLYGFQIEVIDDRDEGGLPLVSTTRTCFAFERSAVALAVGVEPRVATDWVPEKTAWLVNQVLKAGAVVVDALGVIEIATQEA